MASWTLDDIPWEEFKADKVTPRLLSLVKAAGLVEHNGSDYARYLCDVFKDDPQFQKAAHAWAEEEVQHGKALKRWAELADPDFHFDRCFSAFASGYKLPENATASVRGSCTGELIARCVVEAGTSSYYTAMKEACEEPVLKAICAKIAADEFRHYKLFYTYLREYLAKENISFYQRFKIAFGRVIESEDDELAYAFFASHDHAQGGLYSRKNYTRRYLANAYPLYRREHVQRMTAMVWKAIGGKPGRMTERLLSKLAWRIISFRGRSMRAFAS